MNNAIKEFLKSMTHREIAALQQDAAQAGDQLTVNDCSCALGMVDGASQRRVRAARMRIARVILNHRAQGD